MRPRDGQRLSELVIGLVRDFAGKLRIFTKVPTGNAVPGIIAGDLVADAKLP